MSYPKKVYYNTFTLLFVLIKIAASSDIHFNGSQYLRYTPSKQLTDYPNVNRISLKFRTILPSGILIVMTGKNKDTLVLELIKGSLRYRLSRHSEENVDFTTGSNLDDNEWHTIDIVRTERITKITLDKDTKTSLSPLLYRSLTINENIFIGGTNRRKLPGHLKSLIRSPMFKGCMNLQKIDNRDPIRYWKKDNSRRVRALGGRMGTSCSALDTFLVTLKKKQSFIRFQINRTKPERSREYSLKFRVSIRTLLNEGRIISLRQGDVLVDARINNSLVSVRVWRENMVVSTIKSSRKVNDGRWHAIVVLVTPYNSTLLVDRRRARGNHSTVLDDTNTGHPIDISLGKKKDKQGNNRDSMVGCVHDLRVNNQRINASSATKSEAIETNKCKVVDRCIPNSCHNNGRCIQMRDSYECDCSKTNFYGKRCEIYKYKASCAEYRPLGLTNKSYCLLDPDGVGEVEPYTSICDPTDGDAKTLIRHNQMTTFNATSGIRFHHYVIHTLKYDMDWSNIEALIGKSEHCRQKVSFDCLNSPEDAPDVQWYTRDNQVKQYWGGVKDGGEGCACGLNQSCAEKTKLCNCAGKSTSWQTDGGYLTEKEFLPIKRLQVSGIKKGLAQIYIGPLECFGNIDKSRTKLPEDSQNLLKEVCMSVEEKDRLLERAKNSSSWVVKSESPLVVPASIDTPSTLDDEESIDPTGKDTDPFSVTEFLKQLNPRIKQMGRRAYDFGIIEIVVISFAGLAVVILVVKYILYDKFCRREDRGELILNRTENEYDYAREGRLSGLGTMGTNSSAGTVPRDFGSNSRDFACNGHGRDFSCNGKPHVHGRNPINAYYV